MTRSVNELVDHAHEWVGRECHNPQITERIHTYLESNGKQDLRNFGLFIWGIPPPPNLTEENLLDDLLSRMMQYALEREYIEFDDVPDLLRLSQHNNKEYVLAYIRKLLARYLDVTDANLANAFPALKSLTDTERSIREVISEDKLAAMFGSIFRLRLTGNDALSVKLTLPREPLWTNGKWSEEKKRLVWNGSIAPREEAQPEDLPAQCFAVWCEPDVKFQQTHFGHVIVEGEKLAEYVLWEDSLTDDESQEWNTFTETLRPDDDLAERVGEFQFSSPQGMPQEQLMETPRRVFTH